MILVNDYVHGKSEKLYSLKETAKAAHVTAEQVRQAIALGWIHPNKNGNVPAQEVRNYMQIHNRPTSEIDLY